MGKFDDMGIMSRNQRRTRDTHPHFQGVFNLSAETLKRLLREYQESGEAAIRFGVWRKDGDPDRMSIRIDKPRPQEAGGGGGSPARAARPRQERREDPPFDDDRPRDRAERSVKERDPFEDPWGDNP